MIFLQIDSFGGVGDVAKPAIETARAITDLGFMAVTTGITLLGMFLLFRYFLKMFKEMVEKQQGVFLYGSPMEQIRVLQNALFDLSKYQLLEQLERIFNENNLENTEEVREKVLDVLNNIHNDRRSKLDNFRYHGYSLSTFTDKKWIKKMEAVSMKQIYLHEDIFNTRQAFNAINIAYNHIKIEFYNNVLSKS